ncbi:MAG: 4'-phosphopantetheinyl transferase superfamily protein [Pseudomonadales bacterium]
MVSGSTLHDNSAVEWESLPPLQLARPHWLPALPGAQMVVAHAWDCGAQLLAAERQAIERAVPKRINEFATGRVLARRAMALLGLPAGAIGRDTSRRPLWPEGCTGSITHADDLVVAAVARANTCASLGIDLEQADRVTPALHRKLLTASELQRVEQEDARFPALVFSAKEAGYKAVNPLVGKFIGFMEAEVDADWAAGRFRLRYVGEHEPNRVMDQGEGYFGFFERYVLSVFIIPRKQR